MEEKPTKTELHAELTRVTNRMKFLRAAHEGTALPKLVSDELRKLDESRNFLLSELKSN